MEFYEGFDWAVPVAFAAAVHACRFEQGDVLYSDASAYSGSKRATRPAAHHIQVLDPPRTTRALGGEGEGQRFFTNWVSPVTVEWHDYKAARSQELTTTQGQLFTCLWRGDVARLGGTWLGESDRPLLLRDLQSQLPEAAEKLAAGSNSKRAGPKAGHLFALALDLSSDASLAKSQGIEAALSARGGLQIETQTPVALGLVEAERYHPALVVRGFWSDLAEPEAIEDALREVLYAGNQAAETRKGFQLARHGSLVAL